MLRIVGTTKCCVIAACTIAIVPSYKGTPQIAMRLANILSKMAQCTHHHVNAMPLALVQTEFGR